MAKATSCSQRYVFCLPSECASSPPNLQYHSVQHNLLCNLLFSRNNPCPCIHSHFDAHSLPLQYVPFPVSSSTTAHCQAHALMLTLDKVTLPYDASGASKDSLRASPGLVVHRNGTRRGLEINWGLSAPLCILDLCGSVRWSSLDAYMSLPPRAKKSCRSQI